jgi:hypothetical protein
MGATEISVLAGAKDLGMYSVATLTFGKAAHLACMEPLARFTFWIAVAAWVLVAAAFVRSVTKKHGRRRPRVSLGRL